MHLPYHPAVGLGDLLPGSFVVPQNPITAANPVKYIPRIGEILPSRFAVPRNPLIAAIRLASSPGGLGGCCCNGGEGSQGANPDDMSVGYINGRPLMETATGMFGGISWITVAVAAGVAAMLVKR